MESLMYFACYPRSDRFKIKVIDLHPDVSYEKDDWDVVDPHEFYDRDEAIKHARDLAKRYGLDYQMFESRYNSETNEYLDEFNDGLKPELASNELPQRSLVINDCAMCPYFDNHYYSYNEICEKLHRKMKQTDFQLAGGTDSIYVIPEDCPLDKA